MAIDIYWSVWYENSERRGGRQADCRSFLDVLSLDSAERRSAGVSPLSLSTLFTQEQFCEVLSNAYCPFTGNLLDLPASNQPPESRPPHPPSVRHRLIAKALNWTTRPSCKQC